MLGLYEAYRLTEKNRVETYAEEEEGEERTHMYKLRYLSILIVFDCLLPF